MNPQHREINRILLSGNYPGLDKIEISQLNKWLKTKFGANFQCKTHTEATRLIKSIAAWTRQHSTELDTYINSEIWKGQKLDFVDFQKNILKNIGRPTKRKNKTTTNKMLSQMIVLFCSSRTNNDESPFEKNKIRNFISSSKLEGIFLEDD